LLHLLTAAFGTKCEYRTVLLMAVLE